MSNQPQEAALGPLARRSGQRLVLGTRAQNEAIIAACEQRFYASSKSFFMRVLTVQVLLAVFAALVMETYFSLKHALMLSWAERLCL